MVSWVSTFVLPSGQAKVKLEELMEVSIRFMEARHIAGVTESPPAG